MIQINGQHGGGQILRTALSLSLITGKPFRMTNIRGKRQKPGLMRQHLTCVKAALSLGDGSADGDTLKSTELIFHPGELKSGDYRFTIGTAGSTSLVAQTLILPLLLKNEPSTLVIEGGTHNPMAPSADFLRDQYLCALRVMGYQIDMECVKPGFVPAGGGQIRVTIKPSGNITPLVADALAEPESTKAVILHQDLASVAETIQKLVWKKLRPIDIEVIETSDAECQGLTLKLISQYAESIQSPIKQRISELVAEYGLNSSELVIGVKIRNQRFQVVVA